MIGFTLVFSITLVLLQLFTPILCEAQQAARIPFIGYLATDLTGSPPASHKAFLEGLHALGYVEGMNVMIEYRDAEGRTSGSPPLRPNWLPSRWMSSWLPQGHSPPWPPREPPRPYRQQRAEAMFVYPVPVPLRDFQRIAEFAIENRLPTMVLFPPMAKEGALMSYGPDQAEQYRRVGTYIDKILKGAEAAELPVEKPAKFELAINLKAAKALGLTISPLLLLRADDVIQ